MLATLISGGLFGAIGSVFKGVLGYFEKKNERAHELAVIEANKDFMIAEAEANIKITDAKVKGAVELEEVKAFQISQAAGQTDMIKETWINRLFEFDNKWFSWFPATIGSLLVALMALIDCIRRLMRPALTIYVMVGATWITWLVWQVLTYHATNTDGSLSFHAILTPVQAYALFLQIIDFVLFMAASGFGWWFSDRAISKGLFKKYGEK